MMKAYIRDAILSVLSRFDEPVSAEDIADLVWRKHGEFVSNIGAGKYCRELVLDGRVRRSRKSAGFIYLYELA